MLFVEVEFLVKMFTKPHLDRKYVPSMTCCHGDHTSLSIGVPQNG